MEGLRNTVSVEAAGYTEAFQPLYQNRRNHVPEDHYFDSRQSGNFECPGDGTLGSIKSLNCFKYR